MCGFVGDIIGGVVDVIGSVAEFVIDNALPIISTVALNYFAPGIGSYFSISQTAVKAIGGAAISAMNGGSIADIATAGLTPFLPSIGKSLGITLDPTGFINSSIASVLGDNVISSVISNAVGSATMAGVTAVVTGGDILKAAGMAGLSSAVGTSLSKTWDAIKEYAPTMSDIENNFKATFSQIEDLIPEYEEYQDSVDAYNKTSQDYNNFIQDEDFIEARASRYLYEQPICQPEYLKTIPSFELPIKGLWAADTSYYYPEDRSISESIAFGRMMAKKLST
jgi:hypothetical protein